MVPEKLAFSPLGRRLIEADFSGGHTSSDSGLLLLREVDKRHGLTRQLAGALNDSRISSKVRHSLPQNGGPARVWAGSRLRSLKRSPAAAL